MSDTQPFQYGDSLTVQHMSGHTRQAEYRGVFGNKYDQVYVAWPMSGEYKVELSTGKLTAKKVNMWRVCDDDVKRLKETARLARRKATDRQKGNK